MTSAAELVDAGNEALAAADWAAARATFEQALSVEETPEAFEGLSWAAWWLNDAAVLFSAREQAFRLYHQRHDRVAAARMATWIACDYHDFRAEHAIASGWRQRAHRLLDGIDPTGEHAWVIFQEGAYALEIMEDTGTARACAERTAEIARVLGQADYEVLGLALEGLALVTEGALVEGMRRLDEAAAIVTAGELRERTARTWSICYLIYACERVRDLDRAAQWCKKMEEVSELLVFELGIGVCRAHYGGVLLLRGSWSEAERELLRAAAALQAARPPAVAESDARLGELRRRQGLLEDARALFARAEPHPIAVVGAAAIALDEGDPGAAIDGLSSLLAVMPATSRTQRADALAVLTRAAVEAGELPRAIEAATELGDIASMITTGPMKGMAAHAWGAVEAARADHDRARRRLEEAIDLFERSGLPYEAALARLDLATTLRALGREEAATKAARSASDALSGLGATPDAARADRFAAATEASGTPDTGLSPRETEVLTLVAAGMSDRQIAETLFISPHTVHRHVSSILTKLGLPSRAAAAAFAGRAGLA